MPLKRRGPLQLVQREVDEVKRKVFILCLLKSNYYFNRYQELQLSAEKTLKTLQTLTKADEPAPVGNYDQRKLEEEVRLQNVLKRLVTLSLKLSPPGPNSDNNDDDSDDDDDDDSEEDSDSDGTGTGGGSTSEKPPSQSGPEMYTVLSDFKAEQEGDLSVQSGEVLKIIKKAADGWWLAQDTKGNRGVVPKTFLKVLEETINTMLINEMTFTMPSSLTKLLMEEGERYRGSHYIQPELSQSQLSFKDLFLDPDTGKVRAREVRNCVCFNVWSCKMIPTPGVGVQVLSRHIRLCAFDGAQVLSNIHTVRASYTSKNPKTWSFSPRVTSILPTILDGDCFLRCSSSSPNIGILFELGVTFLRNSTGERGDLSCGWAFLKLTDDGGNPLPNRTYELPVYGGTPYEKDVMQTAHSLCFLYFQAPGGVFQQMLQARRQPKLIVKLKSPNSRTRTQLSLLPDTLLYCLSCVHLLALYRQLLADTLLMDRPTMQNADLICSPILSTFPMLLDQTDLLDALRSVWLEAETSMSRAQKRDLSYLKQEFSKVYLSSVYFLLHSPSLSSYRWADLPSEEQRARPTTGQSGAPGVFFDSSHSHLAFDIQELTFDLLSATR
uniref:Nephronophthisis 1 n=1 Tax=Cyprinodon variegatus TaxID=28743 RepID=A0A3Q2E1A9_CYPVA